MKRFMGRILIAAILTLLVIQEVSAEFIVQTVYFRPTDVPDTQVAREKIANLMEDTQAFYASELDRHGFGEKTFTMERENSGKVKIHTVAAKHQMDHYVNDTWNRILLELPNELNAATSPWSKQDKIRVIVIGGVKFVNGNKWGVGWPKHSNRYGGTCYLAGGSTGFNSNLISHEMGHCFALYHKEVALPGTLEHYEARWLSKHYHFNKNTNNFTFPTPVSTLPTMTLLDDDIIRFELELTSTIGLHQAQIFRKHDIIVLDWDYLNGKRKDIAMFEVPRNKWSNTISLQIMDTRGNHHMKKISITLPDVKPVSKNPDLGQPTVIVELKVSAKKKHIISWGMMKRRR